MKGKEKSQGAALGFHQLPGLLTLSAPTSHSLLVFRVTFRGLRNIHPASHEP
jgi:hypothetical protein